MENSLFWELEEINQQITALRYVADASASGVASFEGLSQLLYMISGNLELHVKACEDISRDIKTNIGGRRNGKVN